MKKVALLSFVIFNTQAMLTPKGSALTKYPSFFQTAQCTALSDTNKIIFDHALFTATNLSEVSDRIHQLSLTCSSLNYFIEENMLTLIKKLSIQFHQANDMVARILKTKEASLILMKQRGFLSSYGSDYYASITTDNACIFKQSGIDLNFTYGKHHETCLIMASKISIATAQLGQPFIVEWLINNGADITVSDIHGEVAALHAIKTNNRFDPLKRNRIFLIECFFSHPSFDINNIYNTTAGKTTLLMSLIRALPEKSRCQNMPAIQDIRLNKLEIIKLLCKNGANPELMVGDTSAAAEAIKLNDTEVIALLQEKYSN